MSLRAKQLGAAGVVIDGSLRDLQEHRDLDFPVRDPVKGHFDNSANRCIISSCLEGALARQQGEQFAFRQK